jgi:RecB family exonuclease
MTERLATYHREASVAGWRRADAEVRMKVALGRAVVSGTVDRVEVGPGGTVRIIDLKTGSSKPTKEEVRRNGQLGAYQVAIDGGAFAEHGGHSGGAALLQLGRAANRATTLQVQVPLALDEEPRWAHDLLAVTADAMAAASFTATPGSQCGTCQVKDSCPAQPEGRQL